MPIITLQSIGKLTKEQKNKIAEGFTKTLVDVASKKAETIYIAFNEYSAEDFAIGYKLFSDIKK